MDGVELRFTSDDKMGVPEEHTFVVDRAWLVEYLNGLGTTMNDFINRYTSDDSKPIYDLAYLQGALIADRKEPDLCKPVYTIDTPVGRIGVFEGDEDEDYRGIRICWVNDNDDVIDLIAMIEGQTAEYLDCKYPAFVTYAYRPYKEEPIKVPFFIKDGAEAQE